MASFSAKDNIAAYQLRQQLHWRVSRSQCCAPLATGRGRVAGLLAVVKWVIRAVWGECVRPFDKLRVTAGEGKFWVGDFETFEAMGGGGVVNTRESRLTTANDV
jgi:hypothetical protein